MTHSLLQGRRWEASLSQEDPQQEWTDYNAVTCDPITYWRPATLHPPAPEPLSCGQVWFVENKTFGYFHVVTTYVVFKVLKNQKLNFPER